MKRPGRFTLSEYAATANDFVEGIRRLGGFGRTTAVGMIDGIDRFINEFWTSGQRQSRSTHEISDRARFKA